MYDSKLGILPDIMKGSPAMQSVPDRLMKWVDGDFMKFNFCFANAKSHTWNKLNP